MRTAPAYEEDEAEKDQAEFNLGMGTLIGIFFVLALICGVFFGFGYTLGHRPSAAPSSSQSIEQAPALLPAAPKPSAQQTSQISDSSRIVLPTAQPETAPPATAENSDPEPVSAKATNTRSKHASQITPPLQRNSEVATAAAPIAAPPASAAPAPTGTIMVQIAAVKGHNDAEALASALRRNGFSPTIRTESQDKLLHVQVGPFASRDEAKAMRQKLSNAGYNAFIK
jgi:cell division protein FtsN